MHLYLLIPTKVVKMYEYEDVLNAYDREPYERWSEEEAEEEEVLAPAEGPWRNGNLVWAD